MIKYYVQLVIFYPGPGPYLKYEHSFELVWYTYKTECRLRELASRGQREPGGGIHVTQGPLFRPALYLSVWLL